ncbi:hypothetical protein DFJ43DRAFT_1160375 [Lentinula guzmanii]|uniref:Uncharacterized protein n=1 Tax=Lentinula guzmanii TaxID=2804957 RepID=A0AA38JGA3_9AGAR|nr:hypothetical protein DFJ43DRAFT_1160375 [Lentinula guzmanii]
MINPSLSVSMRNLTRLMIHAGCLCFAEEAGSRLSRWRFCPAHASLHASSSLAGPTVSSNELLSQSISLSSLDSMDSMSALPIPSKSLKELNGVQLHVGYVFVQNTMVDKNTKNRDCACDLRLPPQPSTVPDRSVQTTAFTFNPFDNDVLVSGNIAPSVNSWPAPHSKAGRQPIVLGVKPKGSPVSRRYRKPHYMQKVTMWLTEIETLDSL